MSLDLPNRSNDDDVDKGCFGSYIHETLQFYLIVYDLTSRTKT